MKIEEFLQELYIDELSDMFAGNRNSANESRPKLLPLMNTAMAYAYSKWKIKFGSYMLDVTSDVNDYEIPTSVGVSPTVTYYKVLQIVQLINVYGIEVPNSEYEVLGRKIHFSYPETQTLEVIFREPHTKYTESQDDAIIDLELPEMLIPWLKATVCHRYFASMKTESALAKAADFLTQAQMCEQMFINTNTTNEFTAPVTDKLSSRGFR
jgi:hypothetical protein